MSTSSQTDLLAALNGAIERAREARREELPVFDLDERTPGPTLPDLARIARGEDRIA